MTIPIRQVTKELRRRPPAHAVVGGLVIGIIGASTGQPVVGLAGLALSAAAEPFLHSRLRVLTRALRAAALGMTSRMLLRLIGAVALLAHQTPDGGVVTAAVLAAAVFVLGRSLHVVLSARLVRSRRPALESRNIPLDSLSIPDPAPQQITRTASGLVAGVEILLLAVISLAPELWLTALLGGAAATAMLGVAVSCEVATRRVGDRLRADAMTAAVQQFLDVHEPEVVLYSGDTEKASFHIKMWLTTFERLQQPALIVVRNRRMVDAIGQTTIPVLCVPSAVDLMALEFRSVRAAFYVVNTGNNIHMLKAPHIKSVFIGHGDSDKRASFNPYSRVYSEVWVAGPAGRERYREADVGVRDDSIVEVGRPQLDSFTAPVRQAAHVPTTRYAPTWEGWEESQQYGSTLSHGLSLAQQALEEGSGVRFLYRPHPFTGRRDPAVAEAHRAIMAMIREAWERNGHDHPAPLVVPVTNPLQGIRDRAMRARVSGQTPDGLSALEVEQVRATAEEQFWSTVAPDQHLTISQRGPSLLSCFAQADALVTDVSSVLSAYLSTGRPYAVCNTSGLDADTFVSDCPSAGAGLILPPSAPMDVVLRLARGEAPDLHADDRARLREHLIGPVRPPAMQRFQDAVDRLVDAPVHEPRTPDVVVA